MKLADGRPLPRRMMAAMAQQDCGQCGYNCEDYANAIAAQAEDRLNFCVPGAKETARTLKILIEEMGGGATDPDEAKAKADAKAASKSLDVDVRPGRSRNTPAEAGHRRPQRAGFPVGEVKSGIPRSNSIFRMQALIMNRGIVLASFRRMAMISWPMSLTRSAHRRIFPSPLEGTASTCERNISLGLAPDMLFKPYSYITGGVARTKAKAFSGRGRSRRRRRYP